MDSVPKPSPLKLEGLRKYEIKNNVFLMHVYMNDEDFKRGWEGERVELEGDDSDTIPPPVNLLLDTIVSPYSHQRIQRPPVIIHPQYIVS